MYYAGSLHYSRLELVSLFGWLLWGDFVFTFMEAVLPLLLPILLRAHGANNHEIVFIATTIYLALNSILNPIISYKSDRFRSKWGRRRPFIFVTTPFVVLFLGSIPFADDILAAIQGSQPLRHVVLLLPFSPIITVFGALVLGFQVFNMFVSSVYYYLIPDVVPIEFIGRFFGLFRLCGSIAVMVFNYFVYGLAAAYMKPIFMITAILYGISILVMCWRVKEGEYAPPEAGSHGHWWQSVIAYLRECFGRKYYWWLFLAYSALGWGAVGNTFTVFFYRDELGCSLDLIGKMAAWSGFLFLLFSYPFGVLIDRWGCHRTLILSAGLTAMLSICMYFGAVGPTSALVWTLIRSLPIALSGMALLKWTVEVYPRDRYGQFGSAGALFSSVGGVVAAMTFGWLLDYMKVYRFFLLWNAAFALLGVAAASVVYAYNWNSCVASKRSGNFRYENDHAPLH